MKREITSQRKCTLFAGLYFPWLLCCAQVAGTDAYEVTTESPKDEPLETKPKEEPLPFLAGAPECEACAADKCGRELAACAANDVCSGWLEDVRMRPAPMAAYQRFQIENELLWRFEHDGEPLDGSIDTLRGCAQKCLEECRIGQDFSCVADFDWDLPEPQTLRTGIGLNYLPVSAQVSACLNTDQCATPLASSATDDDGFAELRFEPNAHARGPINYLQFARQDALSWNWIQSRPFADNDYIGFGLIDDSFFRAWHEAFGRTFSGDAGVILVTPVDCAGISAKQVKIEARRYYSGNAPEPCEDCFYAYAEDKSGAPSAIEGFKTSGTMGYVANVPPGLVWVLLRRLADPGDVVSATRLLVRGGEVALVKAHPASKLDLTLYAEPRN